MNHTNEDRERFERIFRAHHPAVRAYVLRRITTEGVDDIVSETFLVAWRRLADVPDEPLPWLLGVARNVIATSRRGQARRLRLQLRAQADYGDHQEAPTPTVDGGLVSAALARLNERDRETLTLVAWEGLTPTEAALVLGIPTNRFRVRLHRAARRLRWALEADSDEAAGIHGGLEPRHRSQGAIS